MPNNDTTNNIQLLSGEVQQIINYRPVWIIRNGISLFLLIIGILFLITFFISYPDVVTSRTRLASVNPPKEVKARGEGRLLKLAVKEGELVAQNDIIGFVESRASHTEVLELSAKTDSMQHILNRGSAELLAGYSNMEYDSLGEIQSDYQVFMQAFLQFRQYLSSGYYLKKKKMLAADMDYLKRQHNNLAEQKQMQQQDLTLAKETFEANKILNEDKVLSPFEYRNEKSKYINKAMSIPLINLAMINNESSVHEKQKEIAELENTIIQQKNIFSQALNTLKARLEDWKNKYLLIAPVTGSVMFAGFFLENQQIRLSQTICYVNPGNSNFYAEMYIPQSNFGKIKSGQRVIIKLPSYPYQEFGILNGTLDFISNIPTDSGYMAKVILPEGLKTTYGKQLQYHEGLLASGEIITADLKLSDRLLNQLKSIFTNR